MIRKFAMVLGFRVVPALILATILAGASTVHAQQTPAQSPPAQQPPAQTQPDSQQSSTQEATPEESQPGRKIKVKEYKNWTFNVGGGASLTNGNTKNFVRGGGGLAAAGVARNYGKYLGVRLDFQWDNLAPAQHSTRLGTGAQRDQSRLLPDARSDYQSSRDQDLGRVHPRRPRVFSSVGQPRFLDRHSRVGLQ